jgi:flagellar basal-body rod protein FlgC
MSSVSFNNSMSGLQVAASKMQATAGNIANANTDGYRSQRVDTVQTGTGVAARAASVNGPNRADTAAPVKPAESEAAPSDVNLTDEMVSMVENENFYEANLRALRAADDMVGTLLDTSA